MENTLENKKKFFALYYDVPCIQNDEWIWRENDEFGKLPDGSDLTDSYANLKSLSSITDEDKLEIASIFWQGKNNNLKTVAEGSLIVAHFSSGHGLFNPAQTQQSFDYLRSKGYALPWMNLSVEQLEEYGWIKIKN